MPVIAGRGSLVTVSESSKSNVIRHGAGMLSLMRHKAFFSTSLACAKDCYGVMSWPITCSSFPVRTTIRAARGTELQPQAVRSSGLRSMAAVRDPME